MTQAGALVTFQLEDWATYYRDCQILWQEHYLEIAVDKHLMPMAPDTEHFSHLYALGALQILTARSAGSMVGYFLTVVRPHTHYRSVLCGFEDSYFLSQPYRKGLTGVRLIKESERALARRGVKKVFVMSKSFKTLEAIYHRLGYAKSDIVWTKWLTPTLETPTLEGFL